MSFDAYKVAVKISLINGVSAGLLLISKQFQGANVHASQLEKTLSRIRTLGMAGAATAGAGFLGLGMIYKGLDAAEEYTHQLNIMNMAGLKQKEIAEAVGDAWKTTGTIITSTATENLKAMLDLRNVLGNMHEAQLALPVVSKMQAVLAASKEGKLSANSKNMAFDVAKAIDMIGKVQNKEEFESYAESISKVIIGTQGRILPQDFMMAFKYGRQAKFQMSQDFIQNYLPTLMLEMKGSGGGGGAGGPGSMLAAMYRMTNQGYINKKSIPELTALGLIDPSTAINTSTSGTTISHMASARLAAENPYLWVQDVLVPAIKRKYGSNISNNDMLSHINSMFRGNQLAQSLIGEFAVKPLNFNRDAENIRRTMDLDNAYKAAISSDPTTARTALHAQWENTKTALMMAVVPVLIPALMKLANGFNHLAEWMRKNQTMVKILVGTFATLAASLAISGTILGVAAGFKAIGAALTIIGVSGGGLSVMAGGLMMFAKALGTVAAVLGAGYAGYKIGGYANDKLSEGLSHLRGKDSSLGTMLYEWTHGDEGRVSGVARGRGSQPIHTTINIDGRKVAESVTSHQARSGSIQRTSSGIDLNMQPALVGIPMP